MLAVAEREQLPVQQARDGNPAAWNALFRQYQLPLYVYVFELVHNEQTSLDLVQETFLAAIGIPNCGTAWQTTAHNQALVNEAQIACALECYRLAHGDYPETLDALAPQFIAQIPHDIIGGEPLIYRQTIGGFFLLYSIGWNETDDDGKDGGTDFTEGDWVWKN